MRVEDERQEILERIEATTRACIEAEDAWKIAKQAFDQADKVRRACKDARSDAVTALFEFLRENP